MIRIHLRCRLRRDKPRERVNITHAFLRRPADAGRRDGEHGGGSVLERTRPTTRGTGASNAPQEEAKMKTCNEKCEVYSRVTDYSRPVANWNKGKQEEFK